MTPDALFINGRVWTGDASQPFAHTLTVRQGRIVALDVQASASIGTRVIDLAGARVLPGFHDAHIHLSGLGQMLQHCDLTARTTPDMAALYRRITEFAQTLPADAWVIGEGWTEHALGGTPDPATLDAATGGRPTWLIHASHHAGFLNSAAMLRLGIADRRDFPEIPGGVVHRDNAGLATGFVAEAAAQFVRDALRPEPFDDFVDAIGRGSDAALAMGITSVTEPGIAGDVTGNGPDDYAAFERALSLGRLRVRTTVMPEFAAVGNGFRREDVTAHPHRLRVGAVKLFADGALSNGTAALHAAYCAAGLHGHGRSAFAPDELTRIITGLHRDGWQIATHAIGDRAIDEVLEAYAAAIGRSPRSDHRHRIEHATLATSQHIARMRALGVVAVPQAGFVREFGDAYLELIGTARASTALPLRSMLDAGITLPGSSDGPVADAHPMRGIAAMVMRRTAAGVVLGADQRLTVTQALQAYTVGSAHAEFAEGDRGTLAPGMLADFVVLDGDPLSADPETLAGIGVRATIVGGVVEFGDLG